MMAEIRARAWQFGCVAAGALSLALTIALGVTVFQKAGLERDVARQQTRIETLTGDLDVCQRNTRALTGAIDHQNQEIDGLRRAADARQQTAAVALAAARVESERLSSQVNRLLARPVAGGTACERIEQIDQAVLEAFQ